MHSFIVQQFEIPDSVDTHKIIPETSIGIEEVREAIKFLSKKPTQSPNNILVFYNAHLLTLPAQNAILKILEEPPTNSLIYLVTAQPDQLITTVLSRCQIISTPHMSYPSDLSYSSNLLKRLQSAQIEDRLKIMEEQEFTRITALEFLNDLEWLTHDMVNNTLLRPPLNLRGGSGGALYEVIHLTRKYLKANCNLKLSMDYLAINLGVVLRPNGC